MHFWQTLLLRQRLLHITCTYKCSKYGKRFACIICDVHVFRCVCVASGALLTWQWEANKVKRVLFSCLCVIKINARLFGKWHGRYGILLYYIIDTHAKVLRFIAYHAFNAMYRVCVYVRSAHCVVLLCVYGVCGRDMNENSDFMLQIL